MPSSFQAVIAARVLANLRLPAVAAAAGVASGVWADTTATRVFRGLSGFLAGRNRGRLPFIEFDIETQQFTQDTIEGGTATSTVHLIAHCGGRDPAVASELLAAILSAGFAAIRLETTDNYTALGDDQIGATMQGPFGHQRDGTLTISHSFARSDYGVA